MIEYLNYNFPVAIDIGCLVQFCIVHIGMHYNF